jgi:hypothetical protein
MFTLLARTVAQVGARTRRKLGETTGKVECMAEAGATSKSVVVLKVALQAGEHGYT